MSEDKCPCCGVIVMVLTKGTIECFKCPFVCAAKDFPRIAAAMGLAKATATLCTVDDNVNAAMVAHRAAHKRVVEVFGK